MLAFGAVLNTQLHLGVSSVGILPLVLSQISSATLGQMTIAFYLLLVLAQLLLVKQLRLKILLQIPFSFVFGLIVDGVNRLLRVGDQPFIITFLLLLIARSHWACPNPAGYLWGQEPQVWSGGQPL